jgi:hypothetical protein
MNSVDPYWPGLSEQLKFLDIVQGQLALPPFDLDDIVRGGRRRHRRRTTLNATGTAAAVIAVVAAVALGPLGRGADGPAPADVAGPSAPAGSTATPSLIDAADPDLDYIETDGVISAWRNGTRVASLKVKTFKWSESGGSVVLSVTASQPFEIDPTAFSADGEGGHSENSPTNQKLVRVPIGSQDFTLAFEDVESPSGLKWTPQDGNPDDDNGMAGVLPLPPAQQQ